MFFIFGVGPKTKVVEKSQFSCPVCRTRSSYELRQQRQYFSLFFIPLFPMSKRKHPANTALPSDPISLNLVPT